MLRSQRGPDVPAGHVSQAVTAHTDIASTIMNLAGAPISEDRNDGIALPLSREAEKESKQEHVTIEFWGLVIPEGLYGDYGDAEMADPGLGFGEMPKTAHANNTYKAIRLISEEYSFYYAVWCTNETELYDLKVCLRTMLRTKHIANSADQTDPGEMRNLLSLEHNLKDTTLLGRSIESVVDRLDALTMVLKSCKGKACVEPWRELHPEGDVSRLTDSLETKFDSFYATQPRVSFSKCALGYLPELEGPMEFNTFGVDSDIGFGAGELRRQAPLRPVAKGHWSIWT